MATYTNTASSTNPSVALGSPTLAAPDIVRFNEEGDSYDTNLSGLGTTAIAEFYIDDGFYGDIGDGALGLVIQAGDMWIGGRSPNHVSLSGLGTGTVALMHWELLTAAGGYLSNYTITKLRAMSGGLLTVLGSTVVANAYIGGLAMHAVFEIGTTLTSLKIVGRGNKATLKRDVSGKVFIVGGTLLCEDATATPGDVECYAGIAQLLGGTITIVAGGTGTIIDFSKATADCVITWSIVGDITIIRPPQGVAMNEPTDAQIMSGRVTFI